MFDIQLAFEGDVCELTKKEASEHIKNQLLELYPGSKVYVDCVYEHVAEVEDK